MKFRKIMVSVLAAISLCLSASVTASYAESASISSPVAPAYEIAYKPSSIVTINGTTANLKSISSGNNAASITVKHTLQRLNSNGLWGNVSNATWTKTVKASSITLTSTKSGLSSGTYRLKSTFTLTSKSGETETITVYSTKETVD